MSGRKRSGNGSSKTNVSQQLEVRGCRKRKTPGWGKSFTRVDPFEEAVFHIGCELCGFTFGATRKLSGLPVAEEDARILLQRRRLYCPWCGSDQKKKIEGWKVRFDREGDYGWSGVSEYCEKVSGDSNDSKEESRRLYSVEQLEPDTPPEVGLDWNEINASVQRGDEKDSGVVEFEYSTEERVQAETNVDNRPPEYWENIFNQCFREMVQDLSYSSDGGFL